jgi:hypothetical protein
MINIVVGSCSCVFFGSDYIAAFEMHVSFLWLSVGLSYAKRSTFKFVAFTAKFIQFHELSV